MWVLMHTFLPPCCCCCCCCRWMGILAWGEGWHNNHHAFEFSARHGLEWYQVDLTWGLIWAMQKVRACFV